MKLRTLSLPLASCLLLSAAPATADTGLAPPYNPMVPDADFSPTPKRLRMRLEVTSTTDRLQGVNNTEDEVYYAIAGLAYTAGALPKMKTVKRSGDPDIWQMGSLSAPTLHRVLFKGLSSPIRSNTFMIVIAEQDNKWIGMIETLLSGGLVTLNNAINGEYSTPSQEQQVVDKLHGEFKAIVQRVAAEQDQIIGALVVTMKGGRIEVEADSNLFSKVIDADTKHPTIELTGGGSKYQLKLYVEDGSAAPLVAHDFFGLEHDACGGDLWIDTKDGNVQLQKGKRLGFVPPSHEWNWYCDGHEEITRASPATDYVIASRASSGSAIVWRVFKDYTPTPDLTW